MNARALTGLSPSSASRSGVIAADEICGTVLAREPALVGASPPPTASRWTPAGGPSPAVCGRCRSCGPMPDQARRRPWATP